MYTLISLISSVSLMTSVLAAPAPQSSAPPSTPFAYRQLTFSLRGADGTQNSIVTIPADGNSYTTNVTFSVSTINLTPESPSFNIYLLCNYYTPGTKQITIGEPQDGRNVNLGPPQEVTSIACQPTSSEAGRCLPNYATCSWSSQQQGSFVSCCEEGFCAASKCRPFTGV